LRILTVAHAYPRWDGDVAGAFIERLVNAVDANGHEMTVLAPADRGKGEVVERRGTTVRRLRYGPARWETLAYRGTMVQAVRSVPGVAALVGLLCVYVARILKESKRGAADVVHAHWWMPAGLAAWTARTLGGPPYVVTLHGTDVAIMQASRLGRAVARRVLQRAIAVTAVSSYLADRAASHTGLPRERILVQPMPIDVERFTRPSVGGGGVVTVGRLVPQKRIALLIDAIGRLKERGNSVSLTIVGDGRERAELERRARNCGIAETTRFIGTVAPGQIPEVLAAADVFVFPAEAEGFGLAVVEALLGGVPVIVATSGGGAVEAVPTSDAGRIVDVTSSATLADAIAEMVRNPARRRLAEEAGQHLRARLSPSRVAEVFEELYARAAGIESR
jgi:glycosyltransferase involved in cell wall biosynthesis